MSNYGMKIGTNIETDTDKILKDTSKYSSLKFYKWGDTSFTTNASREGSVEITHNLGYAPISVVFHKNTAQWSSGDNILPTTTYSNAFSHIGAYNLYTGGAASIGFTINVDATKLYISDNGLGSLAPSTTYYLRYYILVDLAQAFSTASNIEMTGDYGMKISKEEKDVTTAEEYEMAYSSKYKSLQYYQNHILTSQLTLPIMFSSFHDQWVEEATYVDFNHNLGYQPFFLVYFKDSTLSDWVMFPYYSENSIDVPTYSVNGFCTDTFVRVYFWRASQYALGQIRPSWDAQTLDIKCIIFTENLAGDSN